MKHLFLACVLLLSACAATVRGVREHYDVGGAFSVTLERSWADISGASRLPAEEMRLLTYHGVTLDRLYFTGGLKPGASLVPAERGIETLVFHEGLSRAELVEFLAHTLGAMGYVRVEPRNIRPSMLAGENGVRFDVTMQTSDGLEMSAMVLAAQPNGRLNLILFMAPREYYFPMLAPEIDAMMLEAAAP